MKNKELLQNTLGIVDIPKAGFTITKKQYKKLNKIIKSILKLQIKK